MQSVPRSLVALGGLVLAGALLAGGCGAGSTEGATATLAEIQPTSFVTIEPATTTTTTTTLPGETEAGGVSTSEQTYTIAPGDSLSKIASKFDITVDVLINYNGWTNGINHLLLPGDVVRIPPNAAIPGSGGATAGSGTDTATGGATGDGTDTGDGGDASSDAGCTHTVVAGDNPTRVANKYGITVDELSNANVGNPSYQTFLIGSQLNIPPEGC